MPEMRFHIRWPNGREEVCYSPSTIIREHFAAGEQCAVADFASRAAAALNAASERVRARFGMGCAQAMNQADSIARTAQAFADQPDAIVTVTRFEP